MINHMVHNKSNMTGATSGVRYCRSFHITCVQVSCNVRVPQSVFVLLSIQFTIFLNLFIIFLLDYPAFEIRLLITPLVSSIFPYGEFLQQVNHYSAVQCFIFLCSSRCPFSFGHCIVCPSTITCFLLPLTPLISSNCSLTVLYNCNLTLILGYFFDIEHYICKTCRVSIANTALLTTNTLKRLKMTERSLET